MQLSDRQTDEPATENTLPLINIVFLLLIFFMLAGSLQNGAPFKVDPLKGQGGVLPAEKPLEIYIASDGRMGMHGEEMPLEKILEAISAERDKAGTVPMVRLKADAAGNSRVVVEFLHRLKDLGFENVSLGVVS